MLCLHDSQLIYRLFSGLMTRSLQHHTAYTIFLDPSNAAQCPSLSSANAASMWETNHCAGRVNLGFSAEGLFGETNPEVDCPSGGLTNGKIYQINSKHIGRKNIIKTKKRTASQIAPTSRPLTASGFAHSVWVCKERIIGKKHAPKHVRVPSKQTMVGVWIKQITLQNPLPPPPQQPSYKPT